jgi:hypothetical protein
MLWDEKLSQLQSECKLPLSCGAMCVHESQLRGGGKNSITKKKKKDVSLFILYESNPLLPAPVSNYRAELFSFVSLHQRRLKYRINCSQNLTEMEILRTKALGSLLKTRHPFLQRKYCAARKGV